ncbi:aminopeptidase P family protein [Rhodohalobacter sp. SW132]|uniref:aminopeptidase P family protein n=1 Tax=Rhodohalobacter sp. SW132 TaxID=2293433 RepID=UPI000E27D37C|nr:aminopeptidase P family protein [Rhodohalobacter sp. SW132]REL38826.1 aminopeptidase P family protein [Rhodohalobacter sp. SW132]
MPAQLHRKKLLSLFDESQEGAVYIKGGELMYRYQTDYEFPFRQESNFWYLTGVDEPDYHMILDLKTQTYHLFAPKRDAQFAVWHGHVKTMDDIKTLYEPDELHFENKLLSVLKDINPSTIYCLNEEQAEFLEDLDRNFSVDTESLVDAITYCRSIKTDDELNMLRESASINNISHRKVMESVKPGMYEYELKAIFDFHQQSRGLLFDAYNGIHAAGRNSSVLHYTDCDSRLNNGDLYLIDAGFEYEGYASDVTRTYPCNGRFTGDQAKVYQTVLNALNEVIKATKPGVKMEDLHMMSAEIIIRGLKDMGLVKGSVEDLMENDIFALFFPHGLGHFLGLDTHDVGGYPKGVERIDRPGIRFLRARRELQTGMVITVEPGLYFIPALLKPAFEDEEKSKFLNQSKLEAFFDFGGVRIEDNLVITEDGYENLTDVPKEIKEIEDLIKG